MCMYETLIEYYGVLELMKHNKVYVPDIIQIIINETQLSSLWRHVGDITLIIINETQENSRRRHVRDRTSIIINETQESSRWKHVGDITRTIYQCQHLPLSC